MKGTRAPARCEIHVSPAQASADTIGVSVHCNTCGWYSRFRAVHVGAITLNALPRRFSHTQGLTELWDNAVLSLHYALQQPFQPCVFQSSCVTGRGRFFFCLVGGGNVDDGMDEDI